MFPYTVILYEFPATTVVVVDVKSSYLSALVVHPEDLSIVLKTTRQIGSQPLPKETVG